MNFLDVLESVDHYWVIKKLQTLTQGRLKAVPSPFLYNFEIFRSPKRNMYTFELEIIFIPEKRTL